MCRQANGQESKNMLNKSAVSKGSKNSEGDEIFQTVSSSEDCV